MNDLRIKQVSKYIHDNGMSDEQVFFEEKLEEWRNEEITVAVAGDSGTGKSSFINAIRG